VREYDLRASGDSLNAIRLLSRPWAHYAAANSVVIIHVAGGATVRITTRPRLLEGGLVSHPLIAELGPWHRLRGRDREFGGGQNSVWLLETETWLTGGGDPGIPTRRGSGAPGSRPVEALAACVACDAVRVAGVSGRQILFHSSWPPGSLAVNHEPEQIARFAAERRARGV
jgi:hypothetical protein